MKADSPEREKEEVTILYMFILEQHTQGIHCSHNEEAPVVGHEAGGQGKPGPRDRLDTREAFGRDFRSPDCDACSHKDFTRVSVAQIPEKGGALKCFLDGQKKLILNYRKVEDDEGCRNEAHLKCITSSVPTKLILSILPSRR